MITLITAVPGSGKTLYALSLIDKYNKEEKHVFHNIDGLKPEKFEHPHLIHDAPADWRETEDGSLVIYDECQQPHLYPANAKRGLVEDERLTAMETHRHTGHDLIFITQAPTFVHHHVRKLVGQHIHFYRARGISGAMRYEWSHVCDKPNDRKEQERSDNYMWRFPKKYYDFYQSATIHTHKFKMPVKLKFLLMFLIPAVIYVIYRISNMAILQEPEPIVVDTKKEKVEQKIEIPKNSKFLWTNNGESISVMGCINTNSKCSCFGENGSPLNMSNVQCLSVVDNPLPFNISSKN